MNPRIKVAIAADYNGRWAQRVISDANTAATGVKAASASMGQSMRAANGNVANLAAQFNDIGVMLAAGQNPLQLALQQGTQISQVLGPLGAAGSAKALGGALLSMLSPVSLLTIATIGLGAAAVQWLMSINEKGPTAEEALKRHREWLTSILSGYDAAKDASDRYLDSAGRLPQGVVLSDLNKSLTDQAKALEENKRRVDQFNGSLDDSLAVIQQMREVAAQLAGNGSEMAFSQKLIEGMRNLNITTHSTVDELEAAMTAARQLFNTADDPAIKEIASQAYELAAGMRTAKLQAQAMVAAIAAMSFPALPAGYTDALGALGGLGVAPSTDRDRASSARDQGLAGAQDTITRTAVLKAYNEAIARLDTRGAEEEALKRSKEMEASGIRQAESYKAVTESLRTQFEMLGMTTIEQEKFEQVRASGLDASSKEAEVIRQSVQALNDRRDALEVINAMKSPADLAAEEVERLGEIWSAGELDAEQYAWAVERALGKVPDATSLAVSKVGDILGSLASVMQASGEEQFGITKGLSVAMAVLKGYEAVTSAYAAGAAVPGAGAFLGPLYAAAAAAATGAQIANIMSTTSKSTSMKGASGGGASAGAAAAAQPQSRSVMISLQGDNYSRGAVGGLLERLSDELAVNGLSLVTTYREE